jgi:hypothetical protein
MLTDMNKMARLEFCLNKWGTNGLYNAMFDRVHVDKKWFFLTWVTERYYLAPEEEQPHHTIGHKCHIPKCMHLAANGCPRWDAQRNQWFNGKIGVWPSAQQVVAQHKSRRRTVGALEWDLLSLTKEVYHDYLFEKVVPSILQCWLQDNRHVQNSAGQCYLSSITSGILDEVARIERRFAEYSWGGLDWNIKIYCQPANSPDMNVNHL